MMGDRDGDRAEKTEQIASGRDQGAHYNTIDSKYLEKARILDGAIQDIGMGRYQWWVVQKVFFKNMI